MPTIECRHPSGFRITFDVQRDDLETCISWLLTNGYKPDPPTGDRWERTPDGLPLCPKHGAVMTRRKKQGDAWFSHRIIDHQTGEIQYCRGYVTGKEADGYNL